jgi:hypothetical protein
MNALADALKPLQASGPKLLAALSCVQDQADRETLAEAVAAALAEQAARGRLMDFLMAFFFFL